MRTRAIQLLSLALLAAPATLSAQSAPAQKPIDFGGIIFGNYQMRTDSAARFTTGGEPTAEFDIARAYLTFRMPAGERGRIRITTDVFQNASAGYYSGWAIRLKYAYFQYDATRTLFGVDGLGADVRLGMLNTVVIEEVERHWPRWLGTTAMEQGGLFRSADVGVAANITLPGNTGEIYTTVVNGGGYTQAETDRFKDIATRFTWTPFAGDSGFFRTLAITPWYYKGWSASRFAVAPAPQVGAVSDGLQKDRRGVFVGLRDRRFTAGAEFSQRVEQAEGGANTVISPRTVTDRTGRMISGIIVAKPAEWFDAKRRSRFGIVARHDDFILDTDAPVSAANPGHTFTVLGATWDLNSRMTLAVDYQGFEPKAGATTIPVRSWFLHWAASF